MLEATLLRGRELEKVPFNPYAFKFSDDARTARLERYHQVHPVKPKKLKVVLGNACNFRCEYCRQNEHLKYQSSTNEDLLRFADRLAEQFDLSGVETVEWWGGEPLLYWNEIVRLADMLERHIGHPFLHHMTTNGSLFRRDIVDYIKEHLFTVKVSHDGPSNFLRTMDVLANPKSLAFIQELYEAKVETQNFFINSVLTKYCVSPQKIVDYFLDKFDRRLLITKIEPVIPYTEWAKSFCCGLAGFQEFSRTLEHDLMQGSVSMHVVEYAAVSKFVGKALEDPDWLYDATEAKCHTTQTSTIAVCLDGSIVPCQVYDGKSDAVLGHLGTAITERPPRTVADRWARCGNCPVISLCRGTCPWIPDGEGSDLNCLVRFLTYKAMLKAFVYLHTGMYVKGMEGEYKWKELGW